MLSWKPHCTSLYSQEKSFSIHSSFTLVSAAVVLIDGSDRGAAVIAGVGDGVGEGPAVMTATTVELAVWPDDTQPQTDAAVTRAHRSAHAHICLLP